MSVPPTVTNRSTVRPMTDDRNTTTAAPSSSSRRAPTTVRRLRRAQRAVNVAYAVVVLLDLAVLAYRRRASRSSS